MSDDRKEHERQNRAMKNFMNMESLMSGGEILMEEFLSRTRGEAGINWGAAVHVGFATSTGIIHEENFKAHLN